MTTLKFGYINDFPDTLTTSFTTIDWVTLSRACRLRMYPTLPNTEEPIDKPSVTYSPQVEALQNRTWDEIMEEVLEDRAEAWERLADL